MERRLTSIEWHGATVVLAGDSDRDAWRTSAPAERAFDSHVADHGIHPSPTDHGLMARERMRTTGVAR